MKNENIKPTISQGELHQDTINPCYIYNKVGDFFAEGQRPADAEKIVKAVNMHDELILNLRSAIEHFGEKSITTFSSKKIALQKIEQLLKQAEQK